MEKTPKYIKTLLMPTAKTASERKVWSMPLETVVVPFLMATNVMGDTAIPHDALGMPLRLARNKDNSIRFGANGKPVIRVAKPISEAVNLMRENFVATLKNYADTVKGEKPDDYALMVQSAYESAKPIQDKEQTDLDKAVALRLEAELKEAEAHEAINEAESIRELQPA